MSENMESSVVIKGEDSESDDEQTFNTNINNQMKQKHTIQHNQGNVIEGEAPESDDEIISYSNASLSTAIEVSENYSSSTSSPMHQQKRSNLPYINHHTTNNNMDNSLLHNKLVERNILFWQHLNAFIQNTIATNSKQLLAADQLLIKSLVTIQSASKTIKQINENSTQLLQKSIDILTGNFLPKIYFKK